MILGSNVVGIAQARRNRDWDCKVVACRQNFIFHPVSNEIQESLIKIAVRYSPQARKEEQVALAKQQAFRQKKQELMLKKKKLKLTDEHTKALIFIKVYQFAAGWKTPE